MSKKKPEKPKAKPKGKTKKKPSLQIVEVAPPGTYGIKAPDILQSIALRQNLQAAIERMKKATREYAKRGKEAGVSEEDAQAMLESLEELDSAIVPIAYGIDEDDGEDGDEG